MIDIMHTCCFAGGRPHKLGIDLQTQPYLLDFMYRDLNAAIRRAADLGYTHFITGMSQGFDLWAAEQVLALRNYGSGLHLICAIPFKTQAHNWSYEWKLCFRKVLYAADEVHVLRESYKPGCFLERDRYMVEQSSRLICWYMQGAGGTKYTYQYAKKLERYIDNIAPVQ